MPKRYEQIKEVRIHRIESTPLYNFLTDEASCVIKTHGLSIDDIESAHMEAIRQIRELRMLASGKLPTNVESAEDETPKSFDVFMAMKSRRKISGERNGFLEIDLGDEF